MNIPEMRLTLGYYDMSLVNVPEVGYFIMDNKRRNRYIAIGTRSDLDLMTKDALLDRVRDFAQAVNN